MYKLVFGNSHWLLRAIEQRRVTVYRAYSVKEEGYFPEYQVGKN